MKNKKKIVFPQLKKYEKSNELERLVRMLLKLKDKSLETIERTTVLNSENKKRLKDLKDQTMKNM
jgi:hypothetical protein